MFSVTLYHCNRNKRDEARAQYIAVRCAQAVSLIEDSAEYSAPYHVERSLDSVLDQYSRHNLRCQNGVCTDSHGQDSLWLLRKWLLDEWSRLRAALQTKGYTPQTSVVWKYFHALFSMQSFCLIEDYVALFIALHYLYQQSVVCDVPGFSHFCREVVKCLR